MLHRFYDTGTMAVEKLAEALLLPHLQRVVPRFGIAHVVLAVLTIATLGVLVDYAWMLYLRSRMVGLDQAHRFKLHY